MRRLCPAPRRFVGFGVAIVPRAKAVRRYVSAAAVGPQIPAAMIEADMARTVVREVGRCFDVPVDEVFANNAHPTRNVSAARRAAWYILKKEFGWSLHRIGRNFGRNHATVLHAIQRLDATITRELSRPAVERDLSHAIKVHAALRGVKDKLHVARTVRS